MRIYVHLNLLSKLLAYIATHNTESIRGGKQAARSEVFSFATCSGVDCLKCVKLFKIHDIVKISRGNESHQRVSTGGTN